MFFHTRNYRDFLTKLLDARSDYWVTVTENNNISGILPLFFKEGAMGTIVNSLPFYGSHGSVLATDKESRERLRAKYQEVISNADISAATIISNPLDPDGDISALPHDFRDERIGQFTHLGYTENHANKLMAAFHYKTRNMIRKAEKSGVNVSIDNNAFQFLEETHIENMKAIGGNAKPHSFFKLFPAFFTDTFKIYTADLHGEIIAAVLLFYHNNTVEYYTPVIKEAHRDKQGLSLIIHRAMTDASQQGYTMWNWGGTWKSQTGVYTFKKRWGTKDIPYFYYTTIANKMLTKQSPVDLLKMYPHFFVAPFHLL